MHRKRGGSLEQGLVMPSPHSSSSSAPTAAHHLHHPYPSSSIDDGNRPAFPNDGCFSRLPFASIAAFLLCLFGVILFTTMMLWAFNATIEQIRRATYITDLPWLDKVQLLFIISAVAMLVVALTFLLIGVISTGQTRESIFHRKESRRGGRVSCILAICLASLLNLIWMLILALTAVLCFVYTIFLAMCSTTPSAKNGHSCLDLSVFKTLFPSTTTNGQATLQFCDGELQQFCALSNTIVVWYYVGLLGALLICLGLVQFIATNAANYAHIGNEARYSELREVLYAELEGYPLGKMGADHPGLEVGAAGNWRDAKLPPSAYIGDSMDYRAHNQPFDYREQQQMPRENGTHWKRNSNQQQHHFTKNDANQQQQQHQAHQRFHQPQMRAKNHHRSVGAVVGTLRRNSYQNSLNGAAYD